MNESDSPSPPPEGPAPPPEPAASQPKAAAKEPRKPGPRTGFYNFVSDWFRSQALRTPLHLRKMAGWLGTHVRKGRIGPNRLLLLAFRGAGKSTLVGLFAAYLISRQPDLRLLTLSADLALARKMVRNVKRIIEAHPWIPRLKPKKPELWGSEQFTVLRKAELRDPTMLARGAEGNFTGSRAEVVICDDVEVPGNSDTPAKRAALREKLAEIEFVLVPGGMQLYLGTPHSYYSIYAETPRKEVGETRPFLDGFERRAFPIRTADGTPQWPKRYDEEEIAAIERATGPIRFASQMMLTPMAPEQCRFDAGKLLRYAGEVEYREQQGRASYWLEGRKLASVRVWWDPAYGETEKHDRNAIALLYQDAAGHYWIHRVHYFRHDAALAERDPAGHAEADQLCREAARFAEEHRVPAITVEDNGVGKVLPGLLRKLFSEKRMPISVLEHHARTSKSGRILDAIDVRLAAGLLHAHASVCDGPFLEELRGWQPERASQPDDGLDAVAGAILAEPVRLGPYPRAPGEHGAWRMSGQVHQARTEFDP